MSNLPSHLNVELKPLRKNSKVAQYRVLEVNADGTVYQVTTYETIREAVYHSIINMNGDIIELGGKYGYSALVAFYSEYHQKMKFTNNTKEWQKTQWASDLWWANF